MDPNSEESCTPEYKTPVSSRPSTRRSKGRPSPVTIDWSNPKLRKLAPGGSGGKGIELDWDLDKGSSCTPVQPPPQQPLPPPSRSPFICSPTIEQRGDEIGSVKISAGPPNPERSIIENHAMAELIQSHCVCRYCHSNLLLTFPTVCVTAIPTLQCSNSECSMGIGALSATVAGTDIFQGSQKQMTRYALNVLYVLAFIGCGDGGVEAQRLLGFLGIANLTSMAKTSFGRIEKKVAGAIKKVTDAALELNLMEEVRLSMRQDIDFDFAAWKNAYVNETEAFPVSAYPRLTVSMDMGWQKRSSGRRYDSASGHACLVGLHTRKPIMMSVKITFCRVCSYHYSVDDGDDEDNIRPHNCSINHDDGTQAMESKALVDMYTDLFDRFKCAIDYVVRH